MEVISNANTASAIAGMGHNEPPIAEVIAATYSVQRLAAEHAELASGVDGLTLQCAAFVDPIKVDDTARTDTAAALVRAVRALDKRIDEEKTKTKLPILTATRIVDGFFKGLNDPRIPTSLDAHKRRLEGLIGKRQQDIAAIREAEAREAEERERKRAQAELEAAAKLEDSGQGVVAGIVAEQALKSEAFADRFGRIADGPINDLARETSAGGTVGLRKEWGFTLKDPEALRATMGPLRHSFTADAVDAAIRKFMRSELAEDRTPELVGVEFKEEFKGNVR